MNVKARRTAVMTMVISALLAVALTRLARPAPQQTLLSAAARPSETLELAIGAMGRGLNPDSFGPLFASPEALQNFLATWKGRIPKGHVRVENADDLNAGAENGHDVPVRLWIDGGEGVIGLSGRVRFAMNGGRAELRQIMIEQVPLALTTWSAAAVRAGEGSIERSEQPFYGRFRFLTGGKSLAVDAVSGVVEQE